VFIYIIIKHATISLQKEQKRLDIETKQKDDTPKGLISQKGLLNLLPPCALKMLAATI
jgi:hypothetical protein